MIFMGKSMVSGEDFPFVLNPLNQLDAVDQCESRPAAGAACARPGQRGAPSNGISLG